MHLSILFQNSLGLNRRKIRNTKPRPNQFTVSYKKKLYVIYIPTILTNGMQIQSSETTGVLENIRVIE